MLFCFWLAFTWIIWRHCWRLWKNMNNIRPWDQNIIFLFPWLLAANSPCAALNFQSSRATLERAGEGFFNFNFSYFCYYTWVFIFEAVWYGKTSHGRETTIEIWDKRKPCITRCRPNGTNSLPASRMGLWAPASQHALRGNAAKDQEPALARDAERTFHARRQHLGPSFETTNMPFFCLMFSFATLPIHPWLVRN